MMQNIPKLLPVHALLAKAIASVLYHEPDGLEYLPYGFAIRVKDILDKPYGLYPIAHRSSIQHNLYVPDIEDDLQARYDDVPTEQEPDMVQSLIVDPRLFESTPALRDESQRQLKYKVFHTDIKDKCTLEYSSRVWLMWMNLFSAEAHDDFVFRVGLTLMDMEHNPFEEYSIPPHLREIFQRIEQDNGTDVIVNSSSLEQNADRAFREPEEDLEVFTVYTKQSTFASASKLTTT
ncbi:hypothetical protein KCV07_g9985, partial [Aureobasidium melanogenum]